MTNLYKRKTMAKNQIKNPHVGHRQRMRERVQKQGLESLQPHEILEFLLYPFIPMKDTNTVAHELLDKVGGNLDKVFEASPALLMSVKNMTQNAVLFLTSIPSLSRIYELNKLGDKPMLDTITHTKEYFQKLFFHQDREKMYLAIVNAKGKLVDISEIGTSFSQECTLNVKEFVQKTASNGADNIFIAHNHPSGDAKPSRADYDFTRWLVSLCEIMGLKLVDHLIITDNDYYSFSEQGDLAQYKNVYSDYIKFATAMDRFRM